MSEDMTEPFGQEPREIDPEDLEFRLSRVEAENARLFKLLLLKQAQPVDEEPPEEEPPPDWDEGDGPTPVRESGQPHLTPPKPKAPKEKPAPVFVPWAERAEVSDWVELMNWADWLMETYAIRQSNLYECWPHHPGIVEDLAGLKMAWESAVAECGEAGWAGVDALALWHDRFLAGFFARLNPVHSAASCKTRHEPVRGLTRTNRTDAVLTTGQPVMDVLSERAGLSS